MAGGGVVMGCAPLGPQFHRGEQQEALAVSESASGLAVVVTVSETTGNSWVLA